MKASERDKEERVREPKRGIRESGGEVKDRESESEEKRGEREKEKKESEREKETRGNEGAR